MTAVLSTNRNLDIKSVSFLFISTETKYQWTKISFKDLVTVIIEIEMAEQIDWENYLI